MRIAFPFQDGPQTALERLCPAACPLALERGGCFPADLPPQLVIVRESVGGDSSPYSAPRFVLVPAIAKATVRGERSDVVERLVQPRFVEVESQAAQAGRIDQASATRQQMQVARGGLCRPRLSDSRTAPVS